MPAKRKSRPPRKKQRKETKRTIPIARLVPSELFLERAKVKKAKSAFKSPNAVLPPIVVRIKRLFHVLDGNHRVKAAQELGRKRIECRVWKLERKRNVANYDEDTFMTARKLGYTGFNEIPVGTKREKKPLYKEDDELILDL